jgi:hypothetical protein
LKNWTTDLNVVWKELSTGKSGFTNSSWYSNDRKHLKRPNPESIPSWYVGKRRSTFFSIR